MSVFLNSGGGRTELINLFLNSLEFKMQHNPIHRLAGYQSSDLAVFSRYVPAQQKTEEGYLTDWLGIEHSLADLPFLDSKLSGHAISGIPVPSDAIHAEAVEYLSLFAAMETSNETFSMMELGAGWAPWICSGGVVAKRMGKKKIHLIGVEAEGNKVPLMKRHLCKNGLCASTDFDEHTENDGVEIALYHGVINDGNELFGTASGDGFADLAQYDTDGNGWIDEADDIWNKLVIWCKDENGKDQLIGLGKAGVGAIYLGNKDTEFSLNSAKDNSTNAVIRKTGIFLYENGAAGTIQHLDVAKRFAATS